MDNREGIIYYRDQGGNPGGFIEFEDDQDGAGSFVAPAKFLGNLSGYNQGQLSFELINTNDNGMDVHWNSRGTVSPVRDFTRRLYYQIKGQWDHDRTEDRDSSKVITFMMLNIMKKKIYLIWDLLPALTFILLLLTACSEDEDGSKLVQPSTLPDLSGLSWVEDDLFIGAHDAKNNDEKRDWPRVSLIRLPQSELDGVIWEPVDVDFPGSSGPSSDMESICSIPGGKDFLFVESGQEGAQYSRIFLAEYNNGALGISAFTDWPVEIINVEATEVCKVGEKLVFLYAERAEGSLSTQLRWAEISINPLTFGEFQEVTYTAVDPAGPGARPIVAMDVDSKGFIYIVSAYDSGADDGPYRSVVWQIGRIREGMEGVPEVELDLNNRLGNLDGLKVESIAIRELSADSIEIYVGTDDEHYGGIMRMLPSTV